MEHIYQKLSKKLEILTQQAGRHMTKQKHNIFQPNVINLSNTNFTNEQLNTLSMGPNYALEREPKKYLNNLIIETEQAIRQLEPRIQDAFRHIATRKIKHLMTVNRCNALHKRLQYNINQIKKTLRDNNLTTVKADKAKAIVVISKELLEEKVMDFLTENNIQALSRDPTDYFHKQTQQAIQKCNLLIDKQTQRYYLNIKPTAPQLKVRIKTHKGNNPIRPVINNTQAPAYKLAKYMNKRLKDLINLPYTYNVQNSREIANELANLTINENMRIITLDIKDMYVNLPTAGIVDATRFWLDKNNVDKKLREQSIHLLNTILTQNYFQHNDRTYQPSKGIAMGSPISSTAAEIYIQRIEELYIKHFLENKDLTFYKRYVDDILIIYDLNRTSETSIYSHINNIDDHLKFKMTTEEDLTINYLDIAIHRNETNMDVDIYRKPTDTGTVIHSSSNHPHEHKMAAFNYYIHRLLNMPLTDINKTKEWNVIQTIAERNGYHPRTLRNLKTRILLREHRRNRNNDNENTQYKWITFTYHSPLIRRISNMFKHTNLRIAFRTNNMIQQQLSEIPVIQNPSGIYSLKCNTCDHVYVGQSGRAIDVRFREHIRYIRTNNPISAYASHILQNGHEYGTKKDTLDLLKPCRKGQLMNCWETMYIQMYRQQGLLISEQPACEANPMFELATAPHSLQSGNQPTCTHTSLQRYAATSAISF
jgi:hypothetical protein